MKSSSKRKVAAQIFVALKCYFPSVMLMCMSVGAIVVTAYAFKSMNPAFALFCVLAAFLSLFAGLVQAHNIYTNSSHSSLPVANTGDFSNPFLRADNNLTLETLSALIHEGVVLLKNGRIVYANAAFAYILAAQEAELIGSRLTSYMHQDDLAILHLDEKTQEHNVIPSRSTLRLTTRLGDVRWVICSVYTVLWHKEEVNLLIFEDIGALKQAQGSLAEYEQQSRILLERTPLGIAMFDAMGMLKLSNTAWRTTWSNVVGVGGRRFNILQDPFMPGSNVERAMRRAFSKQESGISNYEHNTPWGETRWLNLNFHPMLTPLDQLIGVAMIQQDVTDYVRSSRRENELNEQLTALRIDISHAAAQYSQVIDQSSNVIICFDGEGIVTAWNTAAERRFGLPRNRVMGQEYNRLGADLQPYLPYLRKKVVSASTGGSGFKIERTDTSGMHYERVFVSAMRLGMKNTTVLEIRDISSIVYAEQMRNFLSGMKTAVTMGQLLMADQASPRPAFKKGAVSGDLDLLVNLARTFDATPPQPPVFSKVKLQDVLYGLERSIQDGLPTATIATDYAMPDLELETDPAKLGKALATLAIHVGSMNGSDERPDMHIFQRLEADYALVNMFCKNAKYSNLPALALDINKGETEVHSSFDAFGWLRAYSPEPVLALRNTELLRCVVGIYAEPLGGAGIVYRLPLRPAEKL